jgi:DNA polymerase-3 subunit gamma/tau
MATQSLYRRYRPRRFGEVKGQDHVVRALRNSVAEGREGQAYLFSGPRGTGKTTSARILAKVLNCERPVEGEPCCECESCLSVERGTSYDVHELDAASNNGVDAMRVLIEKASLGTPGRHKVYILDEVHMLSKGAEAALLKTLEEPPPHVVFVLATTDPQKVSDTIRSRTQHLQFHLLPADVLDELVRWVVGKAGLTVDDEAIGDVLMLGAGSARDTLSALELVASAGGERVESISLDEFVEAMIDRDPGRGLTMVAQAVSLGRDPRTLTEELIGFLRNGFLSLMAPELVQLPSDRVDVVADLARRVGAASLVRGIEVFGSALVEMRQAPDPRVLLDVAVVQLTAESVEADVTALLTRLDRLEQRISDLGSSPGPTPAERPSGRAELGGRARSRVAQPAAVDPGEPADPATVPDPSEDGGGPVPNDSPPADAVASGDAVPPAETGASEPVVPSQIARDDWENTIRPVLRGMARAVYAPADFVSSTQTTVTLSLPNAVHCKKCEQQRSTVEAALSEHAGSPVTIELVSGDDGPSGDGGPSGDAGRRVAPTPSRSPGDSGRATDGSTSPPTAGEHGRDGGTASSTTPTRDATSGESSEAPVVALPADDEVDLDDLVEVPPESVKSPIDRLAEAFPGSELIVETA